MTRLLAHKDALETWCPFAFARDRDAPIDSAAGSNRNTDGQPLRGTMCIGHKCQLWEDGGHPTSKEKSGYCGMRK